MLTKHKSLSAQAFYAETPETHRNHCSHFAQKGTKHRKAKQPGVGQWGRNTAV